VAGWTTDVLPKNHPLARAATDRGENKQAMRTDNKIPAAVWAVLVALLILTVPFYWPDDRIRPFVLGLPVWAFVSLVFSALFACVIAWTIMTYWPEDE